MRERKQDSERFRQAAEVEAQLPIAVGGKSVSATGLLDGRSDRSCAAATTDLAWKGPIAVKKCTLLAGSLESVANALAQYDITWEPKRHGLSVVVVGWLFLGPGAVLEVRWTRDGTTLAEAHSVNDLTPPFLRSPDGQSPQLGDRLEFRHQHDGPKGWDVQFTIEL